MKTKTTQRDRVLTYLKENSPATLPEIAKACKIQPSKNLGAPSVVSQIIAHGKRNGVRDWDYVVRLKRGVYSFGDNTSSQNGNAPEWETVLTDGLTLVLRNSEGVLYLAKPLSKA